MPFVKLDSGILDSTLWLQKDQRDIFITALLMATPEQFDAPTPQLEVDSLKETGFTVPPGWYGFVAASGPGILRRAMVEKEAGMKALKELGEPEEESRSHEHEGRRMVRVNGGYLLLNYMRFRDKDHSAATRMRNLRDRRKTGVDERLQAQDYRCVCCGEVFETPYNLYVVQDHDHKTGASRGVICQSCNKVVGLLELRKTVYSSKKEACLLYLARYGVTFPVTTQLRNITQADAESREQRAEKNNGAPPLAPPQYPPVKKGVPEAALMFERLGIPADGSMIEIAAKAIVLTGRGMGGIGEAAEFMYTSAQQALVEGETVNRFWFTDQKYFRKEKKLKKPDPMAGMKFVNQ